MRGRLRMLIGRLVHRVAPAATVELVPFDPAARGEWAWIRPVRFRPTWHLEANGAPVATMTARGVFALTAELRTANASWTFRPRFPGDVLAFAPGAEVPCVRYRPGWFGAGRFEREGRDTLLWRRETFWWLRWGVQTAEGLPLVHLRLPRGPLALRGTARIELEDAARRLEDLPVLLALGWFLALQAHRSHAAH